jgi:hypothetical protein
MRRRRVLALALAAAILPAGPATTLAAGPTIERGGTRDTFADGFILDLCGIETMTTVTEKWTLKRFPDGSETFHVERQFVSDDPRLPIEKGAATNFISPDGIETVVGKPIQLIRHGQRVVLLDAGRVTFGDELDVRGPHPSLGLDLAPFYCP